jgi:hypothetical protein
MPSPAFLAAVAITCLDAELWAERAKVKQKLPKM